MSRRLTDAETDELHCLAQPLVDHAVAGKLAKRVCDLLLPGVELPQPLDRFCPACDSLTYTQIPSRHVYRAPHWWCPQHAPRTEEHWDTPPAPRDIARWALEIVAQPECSIPPECSDEEEYPAMLTVADMRRARTALSAPARSEGTAAPCPLGEDCPDARRYGHVHPAPAPTTPAPRCRCGRSTWSDGYKVRCLNAGCDLPTDLCRCEPFDPDNRIWARMKPEDFKAPPPTTPAPAKENDRG